MTGSDMRRAVLRENTLALTVAVDADSGYAYGRLNWPNGHVMNVDHEVSELTMVLVPREAGLMRARTVCGCYGLNGDVAR